MGDFDRAGGSYRRLGVERHTQAGGCHHGQVVGAVTYRDTGFKADTQTPGQVAQGAAYTPDSQWAATRPVILPSSTSSALATTSSNPKSDCNRSAIPANPPEKMAVLMPRSQGVIISRSPSFTGNRSASACTASASRPSSNARRVRKLSSKSSSPRSRWP